MWSNEIKKPLNNGLKKHVLIWSILKLQFFDWLNGSKFFREIVVLHFSLQNLFLRNIECEKSPFDWFRSGFFFDFLGDVFIEIILNFTKIKNYIS